MKTQAKQQFILLSLVVFLLSSSAWGIEIRNDTVIGHDESYDDIYVYDTPPDTTTVDFYGQSRNMLAYNSSTINFYGLCGDMLAYDSSTINVLDGLVGDNSTYNFLLFDSATANVNIGSGIIFALMQAYDSSSVYFYKGGVNGFFAYDNSTVHVYGGDLGFGWGFGVLSPTATVYIYGYGFSYDPHAWWADDDYTFPLGWVSELSGYGPDGTPILITGIADPYTTPNIHLIPEPVTLLLLSLGGMAVLRKRKKF